VRQLSPGVQRLVLNRTGICKSALNSSGKVPSENAAHCSSMSGSKLGSTLIEMPPKLGEESNVSLEPSQFVHLHLQKIFVCLRDFVRLCLIKQNSKGWLFVSSSTIFLLAELPVSSSPCNLSLENGMQMHTLSQPSVFRCAWLSYYPLNGSCLVAMEALPLLDHADCSALQLVWQAHTASVITSETNFLSLLYNLQLLSTYNEP